MKARIVAVMAGQIAGALIAVAGFAASALYVMWLLHPVWVCIDTVGEVK